jgi:predicted nucleotidyltransferase component of viral defense system
MTTPFQSLIDRYVCRTKNDYVNAMHEVIQEIALIGLSRGKFFEKASFYGGTALRILYGLDRFSEDLDFSLLEPDLNFALDPYFPFLEDEFKGFGINVKIEKRIKHPPTQVLSAFLKTNTLETFFLIDLPEKERKKVAHQEQLKIKFEIDIDPPPLFDTEFKFMVLPLPYSVRSYTLPNLYAGKMCALLFREWKVRVKGRDWYDFIWFVAKGIPLNLRHLEARMKQSGYWSSSKPLDRETFKELLTQKIKDLSIEMAKKDIVDFIKDERNIKIWSKEFFLSLVPRINFVS